VANGGYVQLFLVAEVVVDRGSVDLGGPGNLTNADGIVTPPGKERAGGVEDALASGIEVSHGSTPNDRFKRSFETIVSIGCLKSSRGVRQVDFWAERRRRTGEAGATTWGE
jgi:hypothetical protein